ncbi:hypothetical protein [Nocardioides ultimimeridianus]
MLASRLQSGDVVRAVLPDGRTRTTLYLGDQIGDGRTAWVHRARGIDDGEYAVKLYKDSVPRDLEKRLVELHRHFLLPDFAGLSPHCPTAAVPLGHVEIFGSTAGVVMPLLEGYFNQSAFEQLHASTNPSFMLTLAKSLVNDLDNLHRAGFVVGDLGDANILIAKSGALVWLDCDAWGTHSLRSTHFSLGYASASVADGGSSDQASDRFAMAIHLARFLSLRMLHPYAFEAGAEPFPDIQVRINRGQCWLLDPASFPGSPAPGMSAYPPRLRRLLERTFRREEPPALELWREALGQVAVEDCTDCGRAKYSDAVCARCTSHAQSVDTVRQPVSPESTATGAASAEVGTVTPGRGRLSGRTVTRMAALVLLTLLIGMLVALLLSLRSGAL